jgi:pimeloyl-ACP methyl ester carboxylesterase
MGRPAEDLDPLAGRLAAAGWRVLQPDPRGLGGSTGPLSNLTLHDFARDVAAVIEQAAAGRAVVIGHGFGNRIARTVAADRPDLVEEVVVLGCSGKVGPSPEIAEAIALAQDSGTPRRIREQAAQVAWFGPGGDASPWLDGWSEALIKASLEASAATPTAAWWSAGSAPVLIVQGAEDVSAPPGNGHLLRDEIGGRATLVDLPALGHALPVEDPDAVGAVVVDWLKRRSAP